MTKLATLCLMWAGMVLAISFLEAPVKFTTPSLTLAVGLDVGRHVFGAFNKVEIVAACLALVLAWRARAPRPVRVGVATAGLIVALQSLWLLPVLERRIALILTGHAPPPAPYHVAYIVLELIKLACLTAVGVLCAAPCELVSKPPSVPL